MPITTALSAAPRIESTNERAGVKPVCGKCGTKLDVATAAEGKPVIVTDATLQRELQAVGDKVIPGGLLGALGSVGHTR